MKSISTLSINSLQGYIEVVMSIYGEWINTWNGQGSIWLVFDDKRIADDQLIAQYSLIPTPLSFFGKKICSWENGKLYESPGYSWNGCLLPP